MTAADASIVANYHVERINWQRKMYTSIPARFRNIPTVTHRYELARRIVDRQVSATLNNAAGKTILPVTELPREVRVPVSDALAAVAGVMPDEDKEIMSWGSDAAMGLYFTAQDAGAIKLWERYRIVYSIDPDLWAELGDAEESVRVPKGLFDRIPHPDPFVTLPEPLVFPTRDGLFQRVEGFFVTGRFAVGSGYLATSTTVANGGLSLLVCSRLVHADGRQARTIDNQDDVAWTRISVNDDLSIGEMIDKASENFISVAEGLDWRTEIRAVTRRCLAVLIYLCAKNADLRPLPAPARKRVKGGRTTKSRAAQVVEVGYRLGAQLRAYRKAEAERRAAAPTGRRVKPHVRRAHPHIYWVGPGKPGQRKEFEVKWVSAIPVNFGEENAEVTTVIGVPK